MINNLQTLKQTAKRLASLGLYHSGALSPSRWDTATPWRILTYHRVTTPELAGYPLQPGMYVSPESFNKQMQFLKTQAKVVALDTLVAELAAGRTMPPGTVAITFDDGWVDNYHYAWPVLKELNLVATIFLATSFISSAKLFWTDEMSCSIQALANLPQQHPSILARIDDNKEVAVADKNSLRTLLTTEADRLPEALDQLIGQLKQRQSPERQAVKQLVSGLTKEYCKQACPSQFLTWEQVKEMAEGSIVFGNHSHLHKPLPELNQQQISDELENAKQLLRANGLNPSTVFCYPYGSYNEQTQTALAAKGVEYALSTERGSSLSSNPKLFGRVNIHQDVSSTEELFALHLRRAQ